MVRAIKISLILVILSTVLGLAGTYVIAYRKALLVEREGIGSGLIFDSFYDQNRHTGMEDERVVVFDPDIPGGYDLIQTDGDLALYMDDQTTRFIVKNLITGYLWYSFAPDTDIVELNSTLRMQMTSPIVIEYYPYQAQTETLSRTTKRESLGYTSIDIRMIPGGVALDVTYLRIGIQLSLEVMLDDGDLVVRIPESSIVEEENKLASISVMPNFGSTRDDVIPGYVIIPDGSGALARFKASDGQEPVQMNARYYGADRGMNLESSFDQMMQMSMPIFGIVHGYRQHGMLGIIESGDAYAQMVMSPAGANGLPYNTTHTRFILRETYVFPTNLKGDGITVIQEEQNHTDMMIRYQFSPPEASDYVGIAHMYRAYLTEKQVLEVKPEEQMRLRLEILMADSERGLIGIKDVIMTSVDDALEIIMDLDDKNIALDVILKGWNDDGMSGQMPYDLDFERKLGPDRNFESFFDQLNEMGHSVTLYMDQVTTFGSSSRVSARTDFARGIYRRTITDAMEGLLYQERHFLIPMTTKEVMEEDARYVSSLGVNAALDQVGYRLYGIYDNGEFQPRGESITRYQEGLEAFQTVSLYRPNAYLWDHMTAYYDVPMYASQYTYFDDTIPFLSIVLQGRVDLYGPLINFFADPIEQRLRLIDYQLNPSFIATEAPSYLLKFTQARGYFTTAYADWADGITSVYQEMTMVHEATLGKDLISRDVMAYGVIRHTYEDGVTLWINYTDQTYSGSGIDVLPKAIRIGGGS